LAIFLLRHSSEPFFAKVYAGDYYIKGLQSLPESLRQAIDSHVNTWRAYQPEVYAGKAILFRATEQPPGTTQDRFLGWKDLATEGWEVYDIRSRHTTIVTSPILASLLQACINKTQLKN
jgi:hypothetical protein